MISISYDKHEYETAMQSARALADRVAVELSLIIDEDKQARARMAISSAPELVPVLQELAKTDIDWSRITIILTDDVLSSKPGKDNGATRLRKNLLVNHAQKAQFVELAIPAQTHDMAAFAAASRLNRITRPFDCVLLGLEADGAIAGFPSESPRLNEALDQESRALVLPLYHRSSQQTYLAMTLPLLISARFLAIYCQGAEKKQLVEQIVQGHDHDHLPLSALLKKAHIPAQLFWTP